MIIEFCNCKECESPVDVVIQKVWSSGKADLWVVNCQVCKRFCSVKTQLVHEKEVYEECQKIWKWFNK